MNQVYVGYDTREQDAYKVCIDSLRATARTEFAICPISSRMLGSIYQRQESARGGIRYDDISDAPMATEFSIARFFVPYLCRSGWAAFCDVDFLWRAPIDDLFARADPQYAVMVVKHALKPESGAKMDGQVQTAYPRKNWSSLILFNCAHPSCRLSLAYLNSATGLDLHQFRWLPEAQIGALPQTWNHLVDVSQPDTTQFSDEALAGYPKAAHFTLGTPNMPGYEHAGGKLADEWREYARR